MPRLPVDGKKVIEYRVTLGSYERDQLNRFVDGVQIKNIGTGIGSATDPIEAMLSNTLGTVGGVFLVSWALKRFFNIDVPIPTDLEDISEGWSAIYDVVSNISDETRKEIDDYIDKIDLKEKAEILSPFAALIPGFPLLQFSTRILKGAANFVFTTLDNPRFDPNYGDIYADYVDPGLANQGGAGAPAVGDGYVDSITGTPIDSGLAGGNGGTTPGQNPFGLSSEQRDCVLEKLNLHAAGVPPFQSEQNVIQGMIQICGITAAKAGLIYKAFQDGNPI